MKAANLKGWAIVDARMEWCMPTTGKRERCVQSLVLERIVRGKVQRKIAILQTVELEDDYATRMVFVDVTK